MAKSHLKLVAPTTKKRTVIPRRPKNGDVRSREYLTDREVERLIEAAKGNRWGHRDATMILVAYRHGLRASELADLRWARSTSMRARWPSAGPRKARLARTRSAAMNCGPYVALRASKIPSRPSYSPQNVGRRSRRQVLRGWWSVLARLPSSASRLTRTCCAMPAVLLWRTRGTIPGRCRLTSATRTFSTRCATPSCRRIGSKTSGAEASPGFAEKCFACAQNPVAFGGEADIESRVGPA
jgi:hypothetical protein